MRVKQTLFLVILSIIAGCTGAPKQQELPVVDVVPGTWQTAAVDSAITTTNWIKDLCDESLLLIVDEALTHNFSLQVAAANIESASARATISGAPRLPQLSAGASGSRRKQNFIGLPIPGASDDVLSNLNNTFGVSMDLNWEVDLWGRLRHEHRAAIASVQASEADYLAARLSLIAQVAKSWFAVSEAARQLELAVARFENLESSHQHVKQRYEAGLVSSLDYRLSLANKASSQAALAQWQNIYQNSVRQLEIMIGRYPAGALAASASLPEITNAVPAGIPAELLSRRPDLAAAERRLASATASVSSAKRALLPRISLTGSVGTSTNELNNILNGDFGIWSLGAGILQPLFQGGQLRANVRLNQSLADIARLNYAERAFMAFAEVESALANEVYSENREAALETAAEQSEAARQFAEQQYNRGLLDFISMLEAQRSAYSSESQLLTARRERLENRINLYLALGGGFEREERR